jgi:hypothetical protein
MGPVAAIWYNGQWDDETEGILIKGSVGVRNPEVHCVRLEVTKDHRVNTKRDKKIRLSEVISEFLNKKQGK